MEVRNNSFKISWYTLPEIANPNPKFVVSSEFEESHGTPEHLKQVRNYNCVKLVQSVSISVSVPVSISVSPLLTTLSPNRLDFQRGVQEEVSPKSQTLLKGVRIVESPKPQTQIRLG
jgi:hypothetical protein